MVKFSSEQVRELRRPGVYVYYNYANKAMYIGATCFGIDRAFDHNHKMTAFDDISLTFIPCSSAAIALDLEAVLIHRLQPTLNKRKEFASGYGPEVDELTRLVCG